MVLRNEHGLVKLTDMGLAKVVVGKTYTTCLVLSIVSRGGELGCWVGLLWVGAGPRTT